MAVVSVRIPDEDLRKLQLVAQVNNISVGQVIRDGAKVEIERHRKMPEFRKSAERMLKANREILETLLGK